MFDSRDDHELFRATKVAVGHIVYRLVVYTFRTRSRKPILLPTDL